MDAYPDSDVGNVRPAVWHDLVGDVLLPPDGSASVFSPKDIEEKAMLCICHMDKEYSQSFRHIRYDCNSAVSEGARACEYRLRFDPEKE